MASANISQLYIANKQTGDHLAATEFNKIPQKINEVIEYVNGLDEETRAIVSAAVTTQNNIRVMSTQEYLALGSWSTQILYVCIDEGELSSVNLGLFTLASKNTENVIKGFAYSLPIIL